MRKVLSAKFSKKLGRKVETILLSSPVQFVKLVFRGIYHSRYTASNSQDRQEITKIINDKLETIGGSINLSHLFAPPFPNLGARASEELAQTLLNDIDRSRGGHSRWYRWSYKTCPVEFSLRMLLSQATLEVGTPTTSFDREERREGDVMLDSPIGVHYGGQVDGHEEDGYWAALGFCNAARRDDVNDYLFVIENPVSVERENGVLHHQEKPALVFKDGYKVFCLRGKPVICDGESFNLSSEMFSFHDEETQRTILSELGWGRIAQVL